MPASLLEGCPICLNAGVLPDMAPSKPGEPNLVMLSPCPTCAGLGSWAIICDWLSRRIAERAAEAWRKTGSLIAANAQAAATPRRSGRIEHRWEAPQGGVRAWSRRRRPGAALIQDLDAALRAGQGSLAPMPSVTGNRKYKIITTLAATKINIIIYLNNCNFTNLIFTLLINKNAAVPARYNLFIRIV
jgi:hypothetical protein